VETAGTSFRLPIAKIDQVCVVTPDLRRSMESYRASLGIEPWRILTFGSETVRELNYRGKPATYRMLVALAQLGGLQYELIQPLQGPSIYHEFLERNGGAGLHHFGVWIPSLAEGLAAARAAGFAEIQGGRGTGLDGDGGFAYLDTEETLGAIFELIELPKRRKATPEVYPAP
jgi:catechol 2,3-dioxygenase-like lactoylglutathione lyase family enzyme